MEELDILDAVPHYCPISSHYKWNLEGLLDMVRTSPPPFAAGRRALVLRPWAQPLLALPTWGRSYAVARRGHR